MHPVSTRVCTPLYWWQISSVIKAQERNNTKTRMIFSMVKYVQHNCHLCTTPHPVRRRYNSTQQLSGCYITLIFICRIFLKWQNSVLNHHHWNVNCYCFRQLSGAIVQADTSSFFIFLHGVVVKLQVIDTSSFFIFSPWRFCETAGHWSSFTSHAPHVVLSRKCGS